MPPGNFFDNFECDSGNAARWVGLNASQDVESIRQRH
jgi:hypothetical protein